MKKKLGIIACCVLSASAWGQRRERSVVRGEVSDAAPGTFETYRPLSRAGSRAELKTKAATASVPQAPGVLQINTSDRDRSAWFVTTDVVPKGSTFIAYIAPDGDNFLKLGPLTADEDILPGKSFALPKIPDFGRFWPKGITTYDVVVRVNGQNTHSAADFAVGGARNYSDLAIVLPLIYQWSEEIVDRQVILTIQGEFTSDPVKIVLEDVVAPPAAITQSGGTIKVNLSKVPGMRLDLYEDFLLTVGQAGYADTRVFTHAPYNPANYDPAPPLESLATQ